MLTRIAFSPIIPAASLAGVIALFCCAPSLPDWSELCHRKQSLLIGPMSLTILRARCHRPVVTKPNRLWERLCESWGKPPHKRKSRTEPR